MWGMQSVVWGLQAAGLCAFPSNESLRVVGEPAPVAFPGGGSMPVPGLFQLLRLMLQVLGELYRVHQKASGQRLDLVVLLRGTQWETAPTLLGCGHGPSCPGCHLPGVCQTGCVRSDGNTSSKSPWLLAPTSGSQPCVREGGEGQDSGRTVLVAPTDFPATPRPQECALCRT